MAETLPAPLVDLAELGSRAADFARASRSAVTVRAYRSDWSDFRTWCASAGLLTIPAQPTTVGLYLAARASSLKVSTLRRRVAAISVAHTLSGFRLDTRHPAIADVLSGIGRELGTRAAPKRAISVDELRGMLRRLPQTLTGTRDRAILLVGFAGAFRRSELVGLDLMDLKVHSRGVAITIRRSKTDQEGRGQTVGIPRSRKSTCPVAALERWLEELSRRGAEASYQNDSRAAPVFRPIWQGRIASARLPDKAVAQIVKEAAERIGLDPAQYAGHSLRRGFMTAASAAGADLSQIMKQSRHRSTTVAMGYVEEGRLFTNPASRAIGL